MYFYYAAKKKEFDEMWSKLRAEYRKAGMSEDAIEEIHDFDWAVFKKERTYCNHTRDLKVTLKVDPEDSRPLFTDYEEVFTIPAEETDSSRPFSWVDEIENSGLADGLNQLSKDDWMFLTLYLFYGYSTTEIAEKFGITHQAVSWKIGHIKQTLKNFVK